MKNASRLKLVAACIYELLLLIALWMLATWIFMQLFGSATVGNTTSGTKRAGLQLFLWLVTGAYFVWCWHKTGQTLATKTWKIKLVNQKNSTLSIKQACIRYALASASMLVLALGFIWALLDKKGLFLHDRILKTRFIQLA